MFILFPAEPKMPVKKAITARKNAVILFIKTPLFYH